MSTTERRDFTIALCGFSEAEQKALDRAFLLSEVRARHYVPWSPNRTRPDICVVNEDLASGLRQWLEMRNELNGASFPVLRVGMAERAAGMFEGVFNVFFKRPVLANRILKALDDLVTEVYHFAPELSIHDAMDTTAAVSTVVAPAPPAPAVAAKRILVVDDSESVRKTMELRLVSEGYAVDFAETGEEALRKADDGDYALIFLDVMLPGIDGFEVSRALKRKLRVEAPVVMLTGKTSRIDKLRGKLASADAYLTKPLTIDRLNETLQRFLK